MFEHLDHGNDFEPDDGLRRRVLERGRAMRRRRRGVLLGATMSPLVLALAIVVPMVRDASSIQRITVPELGQEPAGAGPGARDGATRVLLVGSDAGLVEPETLGGRNDAVVLVTLRPDESSLTLMSIPRDLLVGDGDEVPEGKVSEIGRHVGQVVSAVGELSGHPIDHLVRVEAHSFPAIADAMGGLRMRFEGPMWDAGSGFSTDGGCEVLDGDRLLSYLRSRHLMAKDPSTGAWVPDPRGDLGRQERQRQVLAAAAERLPDIDVRTLLDVLADHATVDSELDLATAARLARQVGAVTTVREEVLPVEQVTTSAGVALRTAGAPVQQPITAAATC